jgi:molybdenum cofactor cytidylyltransferase
MSDITPVILAAGDSTRMGYPKALLPLGKLTFLTCILNTLAATNCAESRVILGAHESRIRPLLHRSGVHVITNPHPERGPLSSMQLGMRGLDPDCRGCLIWPVDQPMIPVSLVCDLIKLFRDDSAQLAMPRCGGKAGHPAVFGRNLIEELLEQPPHTNPKPIIARYRVAASWLPTTERGTVEDIDTQQDYLRLTGESLESALARHKPKD